MVGGELVTCAVCGKKKCPWGRDPGLVGDALCEPGECSGYLEDPKPGEDSDG